MNENEINYWNKYYLTETAPINHSNFAKFAFDYMKAKSSILDLGCGNGRDSLYFAENGLKVTSIDQSESGLEFINKIAKKRKMNISINKGDFVTSDVLVKNSYDNIYSRFTIHSITKVQENLLIKNVYNSLNEGGQFFIEVRSTKDDIFGKGEKVGHNTYLFDGHLRRFIDFEELIESLKKVGFNIKYSDENNNFAKYKDENPICIRVIAVK